MVICLYACVWGYVWIFLIVSIKNSFYEEIYFFNCKKGLILNFSILFIIVKNDWISIYDF